MRAYTGPGIKRDFTAKEERGLELQKQLVQHAALPRPRAFAAQRPTKPERIA